jgi:two-component system sensor histidine kinase RpfC
MLESKRYDLMILDLNMPVFGGLEVMKIHNAASRQSPRTPVAILTANATVEAIRECEEAGVDAYLTKPVDAVTLLDTVSRLTASARKAVMAEPASAPPSAEDADNIPFIDENTLHRLAVLGVSDENFLQTVVHGFISETEKLLDAMRTALSNQEYATFKELAHVMKGSSGNVGAKALHQICRKMMQLDHAEFQNSAGELLTQAQSSFKSTKMMLFQYLSESHRASL